MACWTTYERCSRLAAEGGLKHFNRIQARHATSTSRCEMRAKKRRVMNGSSRHASRERYHAQFSAQTGRISACMRNGVNGAVTTGSFCARKGQGSKRERVKDCVGLGYSRSKLQRVLRCVYASMLQLSCMGGACGMKEKRFSACISPTFRFVLPYVEYKSGCLSRRCSSLISKEDFDALSPRVRSE